MTRQQEEDAPSQQEAGEAEEAGEVVVEAGAQVVISAVAGPLEQHQQMLEMGTVDVAGKEEAGPTAGVLRGDQLLLPALAQLQQLLYQLCKAMALSAVGHPGVVRPCKALVQAVRGAPGNSRATLVVLLANRASSSNRASAQGAPGALVGALAGAHVVGRARSRRKGSSLLHSSSRGQEAGVAVGAVVLEPVAPRSKRRRRQPSSSTLPLPLPLPRTLTMHR